jgi:hypothetical protein
MIDFIIQLPFDYRTAVLTQARTSEYRPYAFIVEFKDGSRKFMKGPITSTKSAQGQIICNQVKEKLSSAYLHPFECEIKKYEDNSVYFVCEELGKADLTKTFEHKTTIDPDLHPYLKYEFNDVVPNPFKYLTVCNSHNCGIWIAVMVNYCFRWVFGIADTATRNLMLEKSTGKIYSIDETGIEHVDHDKIWGGKRPGKDFFPLVQAFAGSVHFKKVLIEVARWKTSLDPIQQQVVPLSAGVGRRIERFLSDPKSVLDI